jgi:hypothetical protein
MRTHRAELGNSQSQRIGYFAPHPSGRVVLGRRLE